jgi:chromosome condensin MukBEF ATPase and DNA-binding subunit MukB
MEIAVYLDDGRNIIGVNNTNNLAAEMQASEKGWTLIQNSDPAFSIDNMYEWTVRESDGLLVHKSTGKTPDEETKASLVELTKDQLKGQLVDNQFQQAVTVMTKQAIKDKLTSQMAITELTKQVVDLTVKLDKANGVDSTPETPTDVTSTATTSGANITAK